MGNLRAGIAVIAIAAVTWAVTLAVTDPPPEQETLSPGQPLPEGVRLAGGTPAPSASDAAPSAEPGQPAPAPFGGDDEAADPDLPPPFKPMDKARRPPFAQGPLYVISLDAGSVAYSIARYTAGFPDPPGLVLAEKTDAGVPVCFTHPSITRDGKGTYHLYVLERRCDADRIARIAVYTSRDGKEFSRRGTALEARGFGSAYVVYDNGLFRAWYLRAQGGDTGLRYAESRDGLHFREIGSVRARRGQIDSVVRDGERWYALMQGGPARRPDEAYLTTFRDPRELRFRSVGLMARSRRISARVAGSVRRGSRTVVTSDPAGLRPGDMIVLERAAEAPAYDAVQITSIDGATLETRTPLASDFRAGDQIRVVDRRRVGPSYVCRAADGSWRGAFSVSRAFARYPAEATVAYRASSIRGPWRVDREAVAPLLTLENQQLTRSVTHPTAVTTSPDVQRCP